MTPHRLVMGLKPRILEEAVHQKFEAQPEPSNLARNEQDFAQALKNYRDISLAAMAARQGEAGRRHLFAIIAKKAPLVYLRLKERESSSGAKDELLVKFNPTVSTPRKFVR